MKKYVTYTVTLLMACMTCLRAQTAAEVVSKFYEAIGGQKKLQALNSVHAEIGMYAQGQSMSMTLKLDKNRGIFLHQRIPVGEFIMIQNKDGVWTKTPDNFEPEKQEVQGEIPSEFPLKEAPFLRVLQLVDYSKDGIALSIGKKPKKVDNTKCYVVIARKVDQGEEEKENDLHVKYYFGIKDYLLHKMEIISLGEIQDTERYTDYRELDEIVIPYKITQSSGRRSTSTTISAIRLNPDLPDDVFTLEEGEYVDEE